MNIKQECHIQSIGQLIQQKCRILILKAIKADTNQVIFQEKTAYFTTKANHLPRKFRFMGIINLRNL